MAELVGTRASKAALGAAIAHDFPGTTTLCRPFLWQIFLKKINTREDRN